MRSVCMRGIGETGDYTSLKVRGEGGYDTGMYTEHFPFSRFF
jgi:hypothetical protein